LVIFLILTAYLSWKKSADRDKKIKTISKSKTGVKST